MTSWDRLLFKEALAHCKVALHNVVETAERDLLVKARYDLESTIRFITHVLEKENADQSL